MIVTGLILIGLVTTSVYVGVKIGKWISKIIYYKAKVDYINGWEKTQVWDP
jgi:hypothetical protein